jgi:hypothetical protein
MTRCLVLCVDSEHDDLGLTEPDEIWLPMAFDWKDVSVIRKRSDKSDLALLYFKSIEGYFITDMDFDTAVTSKEYAPA